MRRKISLYIGDQLVDLDEQSFILFNYTMDDLSNPAIVKNSFSQQITLPGTPNNNKIFGDSFRVDRAIGYNDSFTGYGFDASKRTPFTIYNEMSEVLESGYLKLDEVMRNGADISYKVSLYGGLGSFIFSLSYSEDGTKKSLADLDYMGNSDPRELDFTINVQTIQEAWINLTTGQYPVFDVINFAPAYNGKPDGNFAANKALVIPSQAGLADTINGYTTKGLYALVSLAESQDEWAVKDLRSYLQRPVLSMRAFWNAIANPLNNGGYEVDLSSINDDTKFPYWDTWLTLPMITSLGSIKQETGDLSVTLSSSAVTGNVVGSYNLQGNVPSGTKEIAYLNCKLRFNVSGLDSYTTASFVATNQTGRIYTTKRSVLFIQAVAYNSANIAVGGSKVKVLNVENAEKMANTCGYVPPFPGIGYEGVPATLSKVSSGLWEVDNDLEFSVEGQNVSYYRIMVSYYGVTTTIQYGSGGGESRVEVTGDGTTCTPVIYHNFSTYRTASSAFIVNGSQANKVTYTSPSTLRSGAVVTKQMLLSSEYTPAEYLLSLCKTFGLYILCDRAERKVTILKRNDLYQDETIDLTEKVDLSNGIYVRPIPFDAKWYDFILEGAGGAFYDEYLNVEGVPYGIQRVDTGYDFDAAHTNLMDSVIFKNACSILARSRYFNIIENGGVKIPSPFLDKGNKYTLWNAAGETLETDISCPPDSSTISYYNTLQGYDVDGGVKLELKGSDGKGLDGKDILLFFNGSVVYNNFRLSDDIPVMDTINDGVPCWLLTIQDRSVSIPIFSRYRFSSSVITESLDFGVPRQLDIPGVSYDPESTIYSRAWKRYISDRYDHNTKVMTCFVNFKGMEVSQDLLRKFYWYDNSLWVLNRIINYSLTTYDPVECEFLQVQDKNNYLTGQSY